MATVIRIKRRRDEDPAEALLLSCKKQKYDEGNASGDAKASVEDLKSILKFAGTVHSKTAGISKPVRDAIRKEKIDKEYKLHQPNVKEQVRLQTKQNSQLGRYKVIAKQRAVHLDNLDGTEEINSHNSSDRTCDGKEQLITGSSVICSACTKTTESKTCTCRTSDPHDKQGSGTELPKDNILSQTGDTGSSKVNGVNNSKDSGENSEVTPASLDSETARPKQNGHTRQLHAVGEGADEEKFCLLDLESDAESRVTATGEDLSSQITCNAVPLVREAVQERPGDEQFVYDLYYSNNNQLDFRSLENLLTIQALTNQLYYDEDFSEEEVNNEEDEDSNDEGNWRNDYPDENPDVLQPRDAEYDYTGDMAEHTAFESETTDQLADWMSWRCNIEDDVELSSEDELEGYSGKTSYQSYYKRVAKEMKGSDDPDSDSDHGD